MRVVSPRMGLHKGEKIRRRGWWGLGVCALTAFLSWSLMVPLDSMALFLVSFVAGFLGIGSAFQVWAGARTEVSRSPGEVIVTPTELVVRGPAATTIPLTDIEDGWIAHPHDVNLRTRDGRTLVVDAGDPHTADALLKQAGVGPAQRVLTVPLSSAASENPAGTPLAVAGIGLLTPVALFLATISSIGIQDFVGEPGGIAFVVTLLFMLLMIGTIGAIGLLVSSLRRRQAVIGVDGITVKSGMRKTFIPYTSITAVVPHPRGVQIQRRDGPPELLPTWRSGEPDIQPTVPPVGDAAIRQRALLDRIAQAARATNPAPAAEVLDRGDRSIEAWREHIRSLVRRVGYRAESFTTDHLAAVLEDASAPAERRIAAVMGLAESKEPAMAKRVRIAIDTCADDELRAALEHAAEAEHEELERVLRRT